MGRSIIFTQKEAEERFFKRNFTLLDTYTGNQIKLKCQCNTCKKIIRASLSSISLYNPCPNCGKVGKFNIDFVKEDFKNNGYDLLTSEYINCFQRLSYICTCGELAQITYTKFRQGHRGCKPCWILNRSRNKNPAWRNDISDEERQLRIDRFRDKQVQKWRKGVFERDNYHCQICDSTKSYFEAHHIFSWNSCKLLRHNTDNGIMLCKSHHYDFHRIFGRGNNTKEQLIIYLRSLNLTEQADILQNMPIEAELPAPTGISG